MVGADIEEEEKILEKEYEAMQATFGELRKENIRKAWFFTSVAIRPENLIES